MRNFWGIAKNFSELSNESTRFCFDWIKNCEFSLIDDPKKFIRSASMLHVRPGQKRLSKRERATNVAKKEREGN